jgi:hypothetical protein
VAAEFPGLPGVDERKQGNVAASDPERMQPAVLRWATAEVCESGHRTVVAREPSKRLVTQRDEDAGLRFDDLSLDF